MYMSLLKSYVDVVSIFQLMDCPPLNKGNNKITELQTILQRESQNS
jgi:hypothetical protein